MNFEQLQTKGDYIQYCLDNDDNIKDIDTAVDKEIYNCCKKCGVATSNLATVFWKTHTTIENIVALAVVIYKRK